MTVFGQDSHQVGKCRIAHIFCRAFSVENMHSGEGPPLKIMPPEYLSHIRRIFTMKNQYPGLLPVVFRPHPPGIGKLRVRRLHHIHAEIAHPGGLDGSHRRSGPETPGTGVMLFRGHPVQNLADLPQTARAQGLQVEVGLYSHGQSGMLDQRFKLVRPQLKIPLNLQVRIQGVSGESGDSGGLANQFGQCIRHC